MRILYGIIFALTISSCRAQDDYADLVLIELSKDCTTASGEEGSCVKQSQCKIAPPSVDTDDNTGDPTARFTIRSMGARNTNTDASNQCGWTKICCPKTSVFSQSIVEKPEPQLGCGYGNPGGSSLRGFSNKATYAAYADFPWMVALMLKKNIADNILQDTNIGGGTLIHPSVVMTVAHNMYYKVTSYKDWKKSKRIEITKLKCRAGEWNLSIENEQNRHQERDIANVIIHENFNKVHVYNDVALLVLSSPYDLTNAPHIGVGCLEPNLPSPGTVCYSMGWGKDILAQNNSAKVLKKLELPLVGKDVCESLLRKTVLGPRYNLHNSLTCAGGEEGVDTCFGDGGSSLVCRIPDKERLRYSVVGMVAYGVDCWNYKVPGVYAKVPDFYDWVTNKIQELKLDITSFKY